MITHQRGNSFRWEDPVLISLLDSVSTIQTRPEFNRWKKSFKERHESFLDTEGADAAEIAYRKFCTQVHKLIKVIKMLQNFINEGKLVSEKKSSGQVRLCVNELENWCDAVPSVRVRLGLSELGSLCAEVDKEILTLLPGNKKDGRIKDYTSFHMGAVLIADEFTIYESLTFCDNFLQYYRTTEPLLENLGDSALLSKIDRFHSRFIAFCDVLASLGLHNAMTKAWKIRQEERDGGDHLHTLGKRSSEPNIDNQEAIQKQVSEVQNTTKDDEEEIKYENTMNVACKETMTESAETEDNDQEYNPLGKMPIECQAEKKKQTDEQRNLSNGAKYENARQKLGQALKRLEERQAAVLSIQQETQGIKNNKTQLNKTYCTETLNFAQLQNGDEEWKEEEPNYSYADLSYKGCDLDDETRRKCYVWYTRMGQPTRDVMARKVQQLGDHCNITIDDVNRMPWGFVGKVLHVDGMSKTLINVLSS